MRVALPLINELHIFCMGTRGPLHGAALGGRPSENEYVGLIYLSRLDKFMWLVLGDVLSN